MQHLMKNILFYSCFALISLHVSSNALHATKETRSYLQLARQETYKQGCAFLREGSKNICTSQFPDTSILIELLKPNKEEHTFVERFIKNQLTHKLAGKTLSKVSITKIVQEAVAASNPRFTRNPQLTIDQYEKLQKLMPNIIARAAKTRFNSKE